MSDKDQLSLLFKNLEKALKISSVQDITEAVCSYLSKKGDKNEEVHYVLDVICLDFNISKRMLTHGSTRGKSSMARNVAYCVLHFDLGIPIRHISSGIIPRKNHSGVFRATSYFKTLNQDVKVDREFKEAYDKASIKLAEYITNKNK